MRGPRVPNGKNRGKWVGVAVLAVLALSALTAALLSADSKPSAGRLPAVDAAASESGTDTDASGDADRDRGQESSSARPATTRHFKLTPRKAKHKTGDHMKVAPGEREAEGEPPEGMEEGGKQKGRKPPKVRPDRRHGKGGLAFSRAGLAPLTASGNFAALGSWTGATLANTGCCQPPDTQMAVGRNEVVEAVNNNIFVYGRDGTQLATFPASDLFQPDPAISVGLTDPKVLFDPTAGSNGMYYLMYMVCEAAGCGANNWVHMGLSLAVTDNPLGSWTVYDYLNDSTTDLQDQEKLGFSADKITFAVNDYNCKCGAGTNFTSENVAVLQKSDVVAGDTVDYVVRSENTTNGFIFDSMPTTPVNASTSDNTQYVVWNNQLTSNNQMAVIRITGTPDAGNVDFGNITKIPIADSTSPPAGVQPGGTIAGDKMNFQSAMVQGNELWAVGSDGCTPDGDNTTRACTRLVEVTLNNNSVVVDTDVGTQGTYRYNPSVSKDSTGHVYFGFTISSSTQNATASLDASALPLPATLGRVEFGAGDATYTGNRWGDYSGTQQDPADTDDVWSAQEFGACVTACSSGANNWATAIGQFTFRDPHITSVSPNHGPATGGTSVDIFGSELPQAGTVKFGSTTASAVTWLGSGHIRATSPAAESGTVHITASDAAGTSDTSSSDEYTYNPVLSSISPTNGPAAGGQSVTLTGAGLNGATNVSFGGTAASSFTVVNAGRIDATTPAHAGGTVSVTVTTSGGTSNGVSYTFQFPTTTTVTSSAEPSVVGASVTFTATVSPAPDGGTVSFTDNGAAIAGCQSLAVNTTTGTATCAVTYSSVGSHSVVATYSGNFRYSASTSSAFTQRVTYAVQSLYDTAKLNNSGSLVPIRVRLANSDGTNVSSAGIVLTVTGLSPSPAPGTPPTGTFSFQALFDGGAGYLFSVKTTKYPRNTYTLSFRITGDPVTHTATFIIR